MATKQLHLGDVSAEFKANMCMNLLKTSTNFIKFPVLSSRTAVILSQLLLLMEGRKEVDRQSDDVFFQCAAIFLPYLYPGELAAVSLSCTALNKISKSVAARRAYDAARALENVAIPFLNTIVGDSQLYSFFIYSPTQVLRLKSDFRQPWGSAYEAGLLDESIRTDSFLFRVEGANGCACRDREENCGTCTCTECGPSCTCDLGCENRGTQGGVTVKLKILKDVRKGWGLFAAELIPDGKFVCEYAGELLSTKEAQQRQQIYDESVAGRSFPPALLVVKEHLPSGKACMRINIDATRIGNVARFINHACDGGNLDTKIVRSSGSLLPRVCFFAARDIQENEELTFSYGSVRLRPNCQQCFCGASSCTGFLPSENT